MTLPPLVFADLGHFMYECCVKTRNEESIVSEKYVYSMMMNTEELHLLCTIMQVRTIAGKLWLWRARKREKRVRDGVLPRKGLRVSHNFDCGSNFSELRDG